MRLRVGFLGGGMMCQIGHLPFYLEDHRCEVVAVAESRPSLIKELSGWLGRERVVTDYTALLADTRIDAVVVSAPRAATGPLTLEAIEAGKHVLAEKPMAHTAAQAEHLVAAAEQNGVHYSVGYMKRFDPGIEAAKHLFDEIVATGSLGRLLIARFYDFSKSYAVPVPAHKRPAESRTERFAEWPLWPDWLAPERRELYAWFLNAACHDINLLRLFFSGEGEVVSAQCPNDAAVSASCRYGDVPVEFSVAKTAAGRWIEGGEFLFEKGRLAFEIPSPMDKDGVTRVTFDCEAGTDVPPVPAAGKGWSFARQAAGFVSALVGDAPLVNSGREGLADMELIERIWRKVGE